MWFWCFSLESRGKERSATLNAFDLVVTVALGSTLSAILLQQSIALAEGAVALGLLIALQYAVTTASVLSRPVAKIIRSEPSLLVRRGEFCRKAMVRQRITQGEVLSAMRAQGSADIATIEAVYLESDGKLSVVKS